MKQLHSVPLKHTIVSDWLFQSKLMSDQSLVMRVILYVDWQTDRVTERQRGVVHSSGLLLNFSPLMDGIWMWLSDSKQGLTQCGDRECWWNKACPEECHHDSYHDSNQRKRPWVQFIGLCCCITIGALACQSSCAGEHEACGDLTVVLLVASVSACVSCLCWLGK